MRALSSAQLGAAGVDIGAMEEAPEEDAVTETAVGDASTETAKDDAIAKDAPYDLDQPEAKTEKADS